VLIVDDEDAVRWSLRLTLEDAGYTVLEATNGREGVNALFFSREPLVVLLDLKMPTVDGADVLRLVAAEPELAARHSFILVTAQTLALARLLQTDEQFAEVFDRLAVTILPKPFEIERLLELVADALTRLQHQLAEGC
jgi:CheY-like chemotaxis protein